MIIPVEIDGPTFWRLCAAAEPEGLKVADLLAKLGTEFVTTREVDNGHRFTAADERVLVDLFDLSYSDTEIGRVLKFSRSTVANRRNLLGLKRPATLLERERQNA